MSEKLYAIKESTMTNLADTIRTITGSTDPMSGDEISSYVVENLPNSAPPTLQEKTATPSTSSQTITPDSGYDGLSKVTVNAMTTATQATPSISVSSSGLITASATQSTGYVSSGTKSATKQLTTQAAKTVTPSTSPQTAVASGRYTTGAVTVAGDSNLVAENIAEGVSIFGVTGTHSGGGSSGSGSMNTNSITLIYSDNFGHVDLAGTIYENNEITCMNEEKVMFQKDKIINNFVSNTLIYFCGYQVSVSVSNGTHYYTPQPVKITGDINSVNLLNDTSSCCAFFIK